MFQARRTNVLWNHGCTFVRVCVQCIHQDLLANIANSKLRLCCGAQGESGGYESVCEWYTVGGRRGASVWDKWRAWCADRTSRLDWEEERTMVSSHLFFVICFVALSPCRRHHRGDINADTNKHPLSHETVQVCVKCAPFSSRFYEVCIKMTCLFFFPFDTSSLSFCPSFTHNAQTAAMLICSWCWSGVSWLENRLEASFSSKLFTCMAALQCWETCMLARIWIEIARLKRMRRIRPSMSVYLKCVCLSAL